MRFSTSNRSASSKGVIEMQRVQVPVPRMFRQAGGSEKWIDVPHRIKVGNLSFAHEDAERALGDGKLVLSNV